MVKKLGYVLIIFIFVALGGAGWFFLVLYEGGLNQISMTLKVLVLLKIEFLFQA